MRAEYLKLLLVAILSSLSITVCIAQDDLDIDALFEDLDISVTETTEEPEPSAEMEEPATEVVEDLDLDALFDEPSADVEAIPEVEPPVEPQINEEEMLPADESEDEPAEVAQPIDEPAEIAQPIDEPAEVAQPIDNTASVVEADPVNDMARELSLAEELKRQAQEVEGLSQLENGYELLNQEKYAAALNSFGSALVNLPPRPANQSAIQRARFGRIEANFQLAKVAYDKDSLNEAKKFAEATLEFDPQHRGASRLLSKIEKTQSRPVVDPPLVKREDFKNKQANIKELYEDGIEYFEARQYDTAENFFERALLLDPYHISSMRYLKKIAERRYAVHTRSLETTRESMIEQVRKTWTPPIKGDLAIPDDIQNRTVQTTISEAAFLEEKMQNIVIPSIEFRQANIQDVVSFLVEASIIGDPEGEGVNIILNLNRPNQDNNVSAGNSGLNQPDNSFNFDAGFGGGGFDQPAEPAQPAFDETSGGVPSITLNLRRVKLLDAIRYITEVADLKFRIESTAVIITPSDVATGRVITRVYPVLPSFLDVVVERGQNEQNTNDRSGEFIEMGGGNTTISRGNVKEFFVGAGIPFPSGTSITYNPAISSLIVANTQENIELFERLLPQFNVVPNQVEIEARFVEVAQDDLEELGFEWIITDDIEIAERAGPGPAATKERVQINADSDGVSKGLRFFGVGSAGIEATSAALSQGSTTLLGDLLSFSGILTNPELTVVLHALDQNGNVDVLSAPRVTTRSGVQASIEVVREIIYPTEFDVETANISLPANNDTGNTVLPDTFAIVPGGFETRQTGVILNVTPTVGPDGYTIELVMSPEVADLVGWIDYGSGTRRIPQPIFASRNVTTSIVVWDGQTVVMGGLITEKLVTIKDKIPILGDIPFFGRLFRNEGESSSKRNLLIFVTARVVDPAGNPIRQAEAVGVQAGGGANDMMSP